MCNNANFLGNIFVLSRKAILAGTLFSSQAASYYFLNFKSVSNDKLREIGLVNLHEVKVSPKLRNIYNEFKRKYPDANCWCRKEDNIH